MPRNFTEIFYRPYGRYWALVAPGGSPEEGTTHQGTPRPPSASRWVVLPLEIPSSTSLAQKVSSGPENSPKSFAAFGLRLVLIFCEVKKQQLALGTMSVG